ncbi:MAG: hypothetical protein GY755_24160 [Chloroflexi bacterium]|nr:hypothetical protein [Chloroflexota bacterium]
MMNINIEQFENLLIENKLKSKSNCSLRSIVSASKSTGDGPTIIFINESPVQINQRKQL